MSEHIISIPDAWYEKVQRVAKQQPQSVHAVICARLEGALDHPMLDLPTDEQNELQAMSQSTASVHGKALANASSVLRPLQSSLA
jgi:hypothetical protein